MKAVTKTLVLQSFISNGWACCTPGYCTSTSSDTLTGKMGKTVILAVFTCFSKKPTQFIGRQQFFFSTTISKNSRLSLCSFIPGVSRGLLPSHPDKWPDPGHSAIPWSKWIWAKLGTQQCGSKARQVGQTCSWYKQKRFVLEKKSGGWLYLYFMQNILWALSWWASWQGQVAWGSYAPQVADRACSTIPWISQWPPALLPVGVIEKTNPAVPKAAAAFSPAPAGWSHERAGQEPALPLCPTELSLMPPRLIPPLPRQSHELENATRFVSPLIFTARWLGQIFSYLWRQLTAGTGGCGVQADACLVF